MKTALRTSAADVASLSAETITFKSTSQTMAEAIAQTSQVVGEKIALRRFRVLDAGATGYIGTYVHNLAEPASTTDDGTFRSKSRSNITDCYLLRVLASVCVYTRSIYFC